MKKIITSFFMVLLSGAALAVWIYFAAQNTVSETGTKSKIFVIAVFLFLYAAVWFLMSHIYSRVMKTPLKIQLKENSLLFCIPPAVSLLIIPLYLRYYEQIKAYNFEVLGNIYLPLKYYILVNTAGYFSLTIIGAVITVIGIILFIKFHMYLIPRIKKTDLKKAGGHIFLSVFILYSAVSLYNTLIYPPTGDEPHHLLIMKSLTKDGDVNLENDLKTEKSYSEFYPAEMPCRDSHNNPGKDGKGIYSKHGIGLPVVIIPSYVLGGRYGVQLFMAAISALCVWAFFAMAVSTGISGKISAAAAALAALTVPVFVNSSLVLTEMPAAFFMCIAVMFIFNNRNNEFMNEKTMKFIIFTGIAFFPWLHIKFIFLAAAIYAAYYIKKAIHGKINFKEEIFYNSIIIISASVFIYVKYAIYGKFAAAAVTDAAVSSDYYFIFSLKNIIHSFFAILYDRNFGIILYNPAMIFSLWGIMFAAGRKNYKMLIPLFIAVPYSMLYLFWNDWTGSMTPGRQYVPVIFLFFLYTAYLMENTEIHKKVWFKAVSGVSVLSAFILMAVPALRYTSAKEKIFSVLEKYAGELLFIFPDFHDIIVTNYIKALIYTVLIISCYFYAVKKR